MDQENQAMNNNPANGERTFTQEDVNRIVSERLAKEKRRDEAQAGAELAEREQAFAEREKALAEKEALFEVKDMLHEMGLPAELLPVLKAGDKEALETALKALKQYVNDQRNKKGERIIIEKKLERGLPYEECGIDFQLKNAMKAPTFDE